MRLKLCASSAVSAMPPKKQSTDTGFRQTESRSVVTSTPVLCPHQTSTPHNWGHVSHVNAGSMRAIENLGPSLSPASTSQGWLRPLRRREASLSSGLLRRYRSTSRCQHVLRPFIDLISSQATCVRSMICLLCTCSTQTTHWCTGSTSSGTT